VSEAHVAPPAARQRADTPLWPKPIRVITVKRDQVAKRKPTKQDKDVPLPHPDPRKSSAAAPSGMPLDLRLFRKVRYQ